MDSYDIIIIGSGPGGEGAAMTAAKKGKSVLVIERYQYIGGGCTHWGTIPSKALKQSIQSWHDLRKNPLFKDIAKNYEMDYQKLIHTADSVMSRQADMRKSFYDRNDVDIVHGMASLKSPKLVEVTLHTGKHVTFEANTGIILATGARPHHPTDVNFGHPRILDSNKVLKLNETPRSLTIYGAGVIGCEYASIFRNMDIKVNLVNSRGHLLSFLDDEITDALSYHLRDQGVLIRHHESYEKIEPLEDGVILHLKSGKRLKSDYLFWASGRVGNARNLGCEDTGIQIDDREYIQVDEHYHTGVENIYAVGDVIGWPSLASASYDQGRYAATHMIEGECDSILVKNIPTGIYTIPEISSIGRTEKELTQAKVPYEVGHSLFRSLARAQITGHTAGMLKILFHRETLEILGIHCFGDQATEIIHIGQTIMSQEGKANSLRYFINSTFNYPTMAEAYRVAALNGINRVF